MDFSEKDASNHIYINTGKYQGYFPYFLHSCRYNPTVDFLLFTDNSDPNLAILPNVRIILLSLEQFKAGATRALGFEVAIETGYKLCDFKPTYGAIFSDFIKDKEYDFWSYCDIDVIFGNIRPFMTDELLHAYDNSCRDVTCYVFTRCGSRFK